LLKKSLFGAWRSRESATREKNVRQALWLEFGRNRRPP
jgi:hypothetical protein